MRGGGRAGVSGGDGGGWALRGLRQDRDCSRTGAAARRRRCARVEGVVVGRWKSDWPGEAYSVAVYAIATYSACCFEMRCAEPFAHRLVLVSVLGRLVAVYRHAVHCKLIQRPRNPSSCRPERLYIVLRTPQLVVPRQHDFQQTIRKEGLASYQTPIPIAKCRKTLQGRRGKVFRVQGRSSEKNVWVVRYVFTVRYTGS